MRTDELTRALAEAHQAEHPADVTQGRRAVNRRLRRHQPERWGAVAAVTLFVATAAWVAWERTGADETQLGSSSPPPRYVLDYIPTGAALVEVSDLPRDHGDSDVGGDVEVQEVIWTSSPMSAREIALAWSAGAIRCSS